LRAKHYRILRLLNLKHSYNLRKKLEGIVQGKEKDISNIDFDFCCYVMRKDINIEKNTVIDDSFRGWCH